MQNLSQYILLISLMTIVYGNIEIQNIQSISSGLSFGMCRGYCQSLINITSNPYELIALRQPNFPQIDFPLLQKQFSFESNQWEEIISLINSRTFLALDDTIGCPGCADGGIEWIQINWINGMKRVTFESGNAIKGLEALIEKLDAMREEYLNQLEIPQLSF